MGDVKISDLILTDEHEVVDMDASVADAADMLLKLGRGVLVVLGSDMKVKGIVTPNQILAAVSAGGDPSTDSSPCLSLPTGSIHLASSCACCC